MSDDQPKYELVMPFVTIASNGGPHDDAAYVAGWEMGALDTTLASLPGTVTATVTEIECVIRSDNRAQAELVAMRHGWVARFTPVSDEDGQPLPGGDLTPAEWVSVRLLRDGGELR